MVALTELNGWVEHVEAAAVAGVDAMLRETGFVQPPTVHLFSTKLDPPYLGYAVSRPFYRGQDAAEAVSTLGLLASTVRASRVLVAWEHADLCTALELPGAAEGFQPALMVVDADRHGHSVARHPVLPRLGPPSDHGLLTVIPEWGPVARERGGPLPDPVSRLLALWREARAWSDVEVVRTCAALEQTGYRMRWITRRVPASAPSWRLLGH